MTKQVPEKSVAKASKVAAMSGCEVHSIGYEHRGSRNQLMQVVRYSKGGVVKEGMSVNGWPLKIQAEYLTEIFSK